MISKSDNFKEAIYELVSRIPEGKLMTYGDVALYVGRPYASRQVGGVAHYGPIDLPWHRLVNRFGDCASGYYGGKAGQQTVLINEGIPVKNFRVVDFEERRWHPTAP